jgi:phosphohistidine swiveling domain-containing protein
MTVLIPLHAAIDRTVSGAKAANLARLMDLGFPVPAGVVVPAAVFTANAAEGAPESLPPSLLEELYELVESIVPVAVRSSGIAEDLDRASFAGQYETVLGVDGRDALSAAVLQCWESAHDPRVALYQQRSGEAAAPLAVLIQRMLRVESAGVAFTANPVTGARDEVVISAVPAVGEELVSGERAAEEWIVKGELATRIRAPREALSPGQALEVAELARRIAEHFGEPQDVEWAYEDGVLHVLQARPITALPDAVEWTPPMADVMWMRNFRIGEWLPEPATPLFSTLILPTIESVTAVEMDRRWGWRVKPVHALVNGWVFYAPLGSSSTLGMLLGGVLRGLILHPKTTVGLLSMFGNFGRAKRLLIDAEERRWREDRRPRYLARVKRGSSELDTLDPGQLVALVVDLAGLAGEILWSIQTVGGFAWKVEGNLARIYMEHLRPTLGGSHQPLLRGLRAPTAPAAHSVVSLDPATPTLGELSLAWAPPPPERLAEMERERIELEARCRETLPAAIRERFDRTLAIAQRYTLIRDEQVADVTIGWPLLRRALRRLGEHLVEDGVLAAPDDVYYLQRAELELALAGRAPRVDVTSRIRTRARQRRLSPPLVIGKVSKFMESTQRGSIAAMRSPASPGEHIVGMPASPGRVTGPVRVVRGPAEFDRLLPGEVLVAPTTSPAWTPLFARAAAVVTDGGSVAAHASLVAREYGLPAVVAAEGATARLRDGMIVTVDGSAGTVELAA